MQSLWKYSSLTNPKYITKVLAIPAFSLIAGVIVSSKMSTESANENWKSATSIYDFTARDIRGNEVKLDKYKGQVALIVNVASQCGYTATNYKELAELHDKYHERGLRILAFPCNQFGGQEPGSSEEICSFVSANNAKFDLFEKVDVNGKNAHPLWNYLKEKQGGFMVDMIKWNFTKFIVDKNGQVVERHGTSTNPAKLAKNIEKYL